MMRPQPLLEVLGGRWSLGVPVVAAAWDADLAGFALGDGSVALARAEWDGGPAITPRRGGGLELRPGLPPPPLARQAVQGDGCLALRARPGHGFLTGGGNATLTQVSADLSAEGLAGASDGHAEHFAIGGDGSRHATALGSSVTVSGQPPVTFATPAPVVALLFDDTGERLGVADEAGVTLWTAAEGINRLETPGRPCSLAWGARNTRLACGLADGAVEVWDFSERGTIYYVTLNGAGASGGGGAVPSLSFDPEGSRLAAAGARQVLCWALDPPSEHPAACGTTARVPITVVAWHPNRALIAAGTANGAVTVTEPQGQDALHLRDEGGGAVTVLAWSADGSRLAIGTAGGDLGVLPLPDALFRPRAQEASP
ncbi:WD40 repeat domain-containing protein [Acidisoma sp.]|uniref:WD40 repeat domain-containing protein n=1 Tax=Acidisoma sp. TaxID=1872115 RepID=UPI003B0012CA